jgi:hypothetical protein
MMDLLLNIQVLTLDMVLREQAESFKQIVQSGAVESKV